MYKIAIPVTNWYSNRRMDCEAVLAELKRAGASRVWLCTARGIEREERLKEELALLKEHRLFFEAHGIETGAWLSSLGHGGTLVYDDARALERASRYVKLTGLDGSTCSDSFCPSSEPFATDYVDWIGRIAETGIRLIMIDDDYRLSARPCGPGCCCEGHMAEYRRRVGENVARADMEKLIFTGGPNKYRDAWLDMGHDALIGLAKRIRARVDAVDPAVRVGVCAVMSTWDTDGVNAIELTRALAGGTKPFLRTIGAPYWQAQNALANKLARVIELARIQRHWCEGEDVELFSEGDAYPRPRYCTPASFLEVYDMALRADGGLDGILKYMMDYTSSPRYERGYIDRMVKNAPAYAWIEAHMTPGAAEGVDVVCRHEKLRAAALPDGMTAREAESAFFFPAAQRLLCDSGVPMTYGARSVHVVCGENGRYVPLEWLEDGMVLDMTAARLLMERGVDVGLREIGPAVSAQGAEYYPAEDEYVLCGTVDRLYSAALKKGAAVLSCLGEKCTCYRYENAAGQRFLVYPFDMDAVSHSLGLMRSYCRQRQLTAGLEWAGRRRLPAVCLGHPDSYLMCKRTPEGLAVGLWNLSADSMAQPELRLDRAYGEAECFGCEAVLEGSTARILGEVQPYAFAGILLKN